MTSVVNVAAAIAGAAGGAALAVSASTAYVAAHGPDAPLPDAAYGINRLGLVPLNHSAPCAVRDCEGYDPLQVRRRDVGSCDVTSPASRVHTSPPAYHAHLARSRSLRDAGLVL